MEFLHVGRNRTERSELGLGLITLGCSCQIVMVSQNIQDTSTFRDDSGARVKE